MTEWPLVVFTVAVQLSCGLAMGVTFAESHSGRGAVMRTPGMAIFPAVALGMAASLFHLGQPLAAFRALRNIGSSRLSLEVLLTVLFAAAALAYSNAWRTERARGRAALGAVTSLLGLAAVVSGSSIYLLPSRPVWNSAWLPASFVGSAFLLGGLGCALLAENGDRRLTRTFLAAAIAGSITTVGSVMWMLASLGRIAADPYTSVALQKAIQRLATPWYWGPLQISLLLTAVVPVAVAFRWWREGPVQARRLSAALAFAAVIAGVLIGRLLVYSLGVSIPSF